VVKEVNGNVYKTPLNHPALVDLGLILKQARDEKRYPQPLSSGKACSDAAVFTRASRYIMYAAAAYQTGEEDILKAIQGEDEEDRSVEVRHVYRSPKGGKRSCPSFFIATTSQREVVLCLRGTATMPEAITEAVGETAEELQGDVNADLFAQAQQVLVEAQEPLEAALRGDGMAKAKGTSLALVGHSVGGGVAIMATLLAFRPDSYLEKLANAGKVRCYAFGAPPTFAGKVSPKCAASVFSFVNGMDCVPRTSNGSIAKLLQAVRIVDEHEMETGDRVKVLHPQGEQLEGASFADYAEVPEELRTELRSLYGVGTILLMFKGRNGNRLCEKVSPELLDRILMHPDMVSDHVVTGYEESITETLMQLQRSKGCC